MKIGIDARFAVGKRRGIGNYVLQLVRHLALADKENSYTLYTDADDKEGVLPRQPNFEVKKLPSFYPAFEQVFLPRAAAADGLDILHCTGNTAPALLSKKIKLVVTLHDAAYMKSLAELSLSPSWYQKLGRVYRRLNVPRAVKRLDAAITVSEFAKKDLQAHFPSLERISVCPLAAGEAFKVLDRVAVRKYVGGKFGLAGKYFLTVGGTDPQKNTSMAADAFLSLKTAGKLDYSLVIVGVPGEKSGGGLVYVDFASPEDLAQLYNGAEALIFPSLRESFGLPPLEAMACGTPVIASNAGAIPEVAGTAALLFNPLNRPQLETAMLSLAADGDLRYNMSMAGPERAAAFSWARLAQQTLQVYRAVL